MAKSRTWGHTAEIHSPSCPPELLGDPGKALMHCASVVLTSLVGWHAHTACLISCKKCSSSWAGGCPPLRFPLMSLLSSPQVTFKKTKRRVKKIRKKEKEVIVRADDLLPLGDQTQDGDFGSRWA